MFRPARAAPWGGAGGRQEQLSGTPTFPEVPVILSTSAGWRGTTVARFRPPEAQRGPWQPCPRPRPLGSLRRPQRPPEAQHSAWRPCPRPRPLGSLRRPQSPLEAQHSPWRPCPRPRPPGSLRRPQGPADKSQRRFHLLRRQHLARPDFSKLSPEGPVESANRTWDPTRP